MFHRNVSNLFSCCCCCSLFAFWNLCSAIRQQKDKQQEHRINGKEWENDEESTKITHLLLLQIHKKSSRTKSYKQNMKEHGCRASHNLSAYGESEQTKQNIQFYSSTSIR